MLECSRHCHLFACLLSIRTSTCIVTSHTEKILISYFKRHKPKSFTQNGLGVSRSKRLAQHAQGPGLDPQHLKNKLSTKAFVGTVSLPPTLRGSVSSLPRLGFLLPGLPSSVSLFKFYPMKFLAHIYLERKTFKSLTTNKSISISATSSGNLFLSSDKKILSSHLGRNRTHA